MSSGILRRSLEKHSVPDLSLPTYQSVEPVRHERIKFTLAIFKSRHFSNLYIINRFARTCHLGSDGQPTCDCPPGYVGRRCEQCASGYQGNPLIPGDMCVPLQQCDPNGSVSPNADPHTGKCHCKVKRVDNNVAPTCNFL